ncbi:hypothetical protein RsS62_63890 [Rhizobium dioscoreae]|nr:hypothetical protein RsS62_63890 [Rhizobium dioscoreae]
MDLSPGMRIVPERPAERRATAGWGRVSCGMGNSFAMPVFHPHSVLAALLLRQMFCGSRQLVSTGPFPSHPAMRKKHVRGGLKFSFDRNGRND